MQTASVKTGFGYFKDSQGRIIAKAELQAGDHEVKAGYSYHEVADAAALALIQIWQDPIDTERQANEAKIKARVRQLAISDLKDKGELLGDYE